MAYAIRVMCSHTRIKFDQHLLTGLPCSKHMTQLKPIFDLLEQSVKSDKISIAQKRAGAKRKANPFVMLRAENDDSGNETDSDDSGNESIPVATYYDPVNKFVKRLLSDGHSGSQCCAPAITPIMHGNVRQVLPRLCQLSASMLV
jgi:hypothetical protein